MAMSLVWAVPLVADSHGRGRNKLQLGLCADRDVLKQVMVPMRKRLPVLDDLQVRQAAALGRVAQESRQRGDTHRPGGQLGLQAPHYSGLGGRMDGCRGGAAGGRTCASGGLVERDTTVYPLVSLINKDNHTHVRMGIGWGGMRRAGLEKLSKKCNCEKTKITPKKT